MVVGKVVRLVLVAALVVTSGVSGMSSAQSPGKAREGKANAPGGNGAEAATPVKAAEWDRQYTTHAKSTASKHASLGTKFKGKQEIPRAIRHFRLALSLDAANGEARRGLGFVQKNGEWVPGESMLAYPEPVDESTMSDAALKAHREKVAARNKAIAPLLADELLLGSEAADTFLSLGNLALSSELDSRAADALRLASAYAPQREDIMRARGFEDYRGEWVHPVVARVAKSASEMLAAASSGAKQQEPDPQGDPIGVPFHVRRDETQFVAARSAKDDERAARLVTVGDGTVRLCKSLLGLAGKPPFMQPVFTITEVQDDAQYKAWLGKFDTATGAQASLNRRSTNCTVENPYGCISIGFDAERGDDAAANSVALAVLGNHRRAGVTAPWVRLGFSYAVTTQLLGTTHLKRYEVENEGRTRDHSVDKNRKRRGLPYGPAEFRRLAVEMVRIGEDIPLADLIATPLNKMSERHIAKSLTMMEFLMGLHGDKLSAWLAKPAKDAESEMLGLAELLGTDAAGLQKQWEAWLAVHY